MSRLGTCLIAAVLSTLSLPVLVHAQMPGGLQYHYTCTGFSSSSAPQSMNIASATVPGSINDRWSWDLKAMESCRQDSIRFFGSHPAAAITAPPSTSSTDAGSDASSMPPTATAARSATLAEPD